MPLRGSVRFLLPSLRRRAARWSVMGACAVALAVCGAAAFKDAFPTIEQDGIAQALRQSVWNQALSGYSTPLRWPFEDLSGSLSLTPSSKVPRLGLSASMRAEPVIPLAPVAEVRPAEAAAKKNETVEGPVSGDLALRDVEIGDSITFTAADGAICVYRVTGRPVVDPHLAAGDAGRAVGEATLFECGPLESLIMKATQAAPKRAQAGDQQKL